MGFSREKANERERNRQKSIGNAFDLLRSRLPRTLRDQKPSRAATLKSAAEYILHLQRILEEMNNARISGKTTNYYAETDYGKVPYFSQEAIWVPPEHEN